MLCGVCKGTHSQDAGCGDAGASTVPAQEPSSVLAFPSREAEDCFFFDDFCLNVREQTLTNAGKLVPLTPKSLDTLLTLVRHAGHLLDKEKILDSVWRDQFVEEGVLPFNIRQLRKALKDDARVPRFIETVPRRGYKFIAPVRRGSPSAKPEVEVTFSGGFGNRSSRLVGRKAEISAISELVSRDDVRLLTLTGVGGTGKTRLACEAAVQFRSWFPDGVFCIDLSSLLDPSQLAETISSALNLTSLVSSNTIEAVAAFFRPRTSLLVLDNFEQIVDAAQDLNAIMAAAPNVKIIVTSREKLKLSSEVEFKVPPLELPPPEATGRTGDLERFESIRLFLDRALAARGDIRLEAEDLDAAAGICRKLDGLPLALELAASRAGVLSFQEILEKLEEGLGLLAAGYRDVPARQQTMRSTIEWSYRLLDESEKAGFAALSVFEGGFSYKAAERILSTDSVSGIVDSSVLDTLTSLTEKGLLQTISGRGSELRFRMLVVVRDFALTIARESIDIDAVRSAHASYFLEFSEKRTGELIAEDAPVALGELRTEHDNIRSALRWTIERDPDTAGRIAAAVRHFWTIHGHSKEGRDWLEAALAAAPDMEPDVKLEILTGLGNMAQFHGEYETARECYEECYEQSRASGDDWNLARALRGIGAVDYMNHEFEAAGVKLAEALELSRSIGDEFGSAAALSRLGEIALCMSDIESARKHTSTSLEIFRRLSDWQGIASKLTSLGIFQFSAGDIAAAAECMRESMEVGSEIGDEIHFRVNLEIAAALYARVGDANSAAILAGLAEARGEAIDYPHEPAEGKFRRTYIEELEARLSPTEYRRRVAEGRLLSKEEGWALALAVPAAGKSRRPD